MSPSLQNKKLKVALLGNPNAGKSSLFNALTGLRQKTGNYSGVTVDRHEGVTRTVVDGVNYTYTIVDLPGLYSLFPKSNDELIACKTLLDERESIDVVVIVADSTNLKRNLLLATQLIDLRFRTVVALSFTDEAEAQKIVIDIEGLRQTLGVDVVQVDSRNLKGIDALKASIATARISDSTFRDISMQTGATDHGYRSFIRARMASPVQKDENSDKLYRFNIINYVIARYVKSPAQLSRKETTARIDAVTTNRFWGFAVLLTVLFLVFQFIFFISETPMHWIESAFLSLASFVSETLPRGKMNDLIVNGIIPGVSGVVMFVPQIAFLFLFIGFLEDSGYMARASFIMDRLLRPFGLNGRSVIPLISGTACAVPSIMATRTISNVKERLITIFILPLISCSARLPVYTLLISILYPAGSFLGIFNARGAVLFLLYILGFIASLLTAFVLKKLVTIRETSFFVMELPVYRWPQLRNICIMVFGKVKIFVKEAGLIIFAISIILWFLSAHGSSSAYDSIEARKSELSEISAQPDTLAEYRELQQQSLEHSYIGQLGHVIEPAIRPLGFDWKIGIAIITSFAAREVFVGTMATIYQSEGQELEGIRTKLRKQQNADGKPIYSPAVCWALLLFYAFALQCMSTVAVVKRETRSWKWVTLQLVFMSSLAYVSAFAAYNILS